MDYIFFKESSPEWGEIWDKVREHPINEGLDEPCTALNEGEEWQYLGSFRSGKNVISQFVHNKHPKTQERYKYSIRHTLISEDSIGKTSRIK